MELGKHLGKGLWGFADKSLPVIYGVGFIFLVIRLLPESEFGVFVVIQTIYYLFLALGSSFVLVPLTKYESEKNVDEDIFPSSAFIYLTFFLFISVPLIIFNLEISNLFDKNLSNKISGAIFYLPLLFLTGIPRYLILASLQAKFQIKKIFWIDFSYFVGSMILIYMLNLLNLFHTAIDLIQLTIIANLISSFLAIVLSINIIKIRFKINPASIKKILSIGKYSLGSSINYAIYIQLDTLLVAHFTGIHGAALYGAVKILTRIYDIYSQTIQMFVIPASSLLESKNEKEQLSALVEKSLCFSSYSIIPIIFIFAFFSDSIIHILYQSKYPEAKLLLKIFSLSGLFIPWLSVTSSVLFGLGKTKTIFLLTLINLVINILFYAIGGILYGIHGIVIGLISSQFFMGILWVISTRKFVNFSFISVLNRTRDIKNFLLSKL